MDSDSTRGAYWNVLTVDGSEGAAELVTQCGASFRSELDPEPAGLLRACDVGDDPDALAYRRLIEWQRVHWGVPAGLCWVRAQRRESDGSAVLKLHTEVASFLRPSVMLAVHFPESHVRLEYQPPAGPRVAVFTATRATHEGRQPDDRHFWWDGDRQADELTRQRGCTGPPETVVAGELDTPSWATGDGEADGVRRDAADAAERTADHWRTTKDTDALLTDIGRMVDDREWVASLVALSDLRRRCRGYPRLAAEMGWLCSRSSDFLDAMDSPAAEALSGDELLADRVAETLRVTAGMWAAQQTAPGGHRDLLETTVSLHRDLVGSTG